MRSRFLLALTSILIAAFTYWVLPAIGATTIGSEAAEIKAQKRFVDGEPVAVAGLLRTGPRCLPDRTVEIRDVGPGVDDVLGQAKVNGKGEWEIPFEKSWSDKTLYASVAVTFRNISEQNGNEVNLACEGASTPVGMPVSARAESRLGYIQLITGPAGVRLGIVGSVFSDTAECEDKRLIVIADPTKGGGEKTIATTTSRRDGYWRQPDLPKLNEIERVIVTVEPKLILSETGKDFLLCGGRTMGKFF